MSGTKLKPIIATQNLAFRNINTWKQVANTPYIRKKNYCKDICIKIVQYANY